MKKIRQAVIIAGGQGTRLRPLTDNLPKPMVPVNGKPFLEYLIELLRKNDFKEVVLLLGYLPEKVTEHFGDGSKFGISIKYSITPVEDEIGTRLRAAGHLFDDHFLVMNCDNYWPLKISRLIDFFNAKNPLVSLVIYSNKDKMTKNNFELGEGGYIKKFDPTRNDSGLNGVNLNYAITSREILKLFPQEDNFDYERTIFPQLISSGKLAGYLTHERYYSIGNLERLPITEKYLKPRRVIFLDRDGVINKKMARKSPDYVKNWDEFEFLPGAIEAIRLLTEKGYEIYAVTNQAGIARGEVSEKDLLQMHDNMVKELAGQGGKIVKIYYCPHGWDEGCECRKPKPGMFYQAARENHINLEKAIFVGDDERDKQAGDAIGCKTILVSPEKGLADAIKFLGL